VAPATFTGSQTSPVGRLADGTPHYAPIGVVEADETGVRCHLCGRWFRSVPPHLRVHGIDRAAYVEMFGLELTGALEGALTRKRRSVALSTRLVDEPAIREASAAAANRARSGALARSAAAANTGRHHPPQRREKTLAALGAVSRDAQARANRRRADEELLRAGQEAVARRGYPDIKTYVLQGFAAGRSLAGLSVAVGLHKDWLSRHLDKVVDDESWRDQLSRPRDDPRWAAFLTAAGFADVETYLRERHLHQHRSLAAIALECGLGRTAVQSAFEQYSVPFQRYASSRYAGSRRVDASRTGREAGARSAEDA
jgi:hypothetical protein